MNKREFIDGVRKGWETAEFTRFTSLKMDGDKKCCCAQGAFLLSRGCEIVLKDGFYQFKSGNEVEALPPELRFEIERINDIEAASVINPKEYVLRNLETIEWPSS